MFRIINRLTSNEDERQDLWLAYLQGACITTFISELEKNRITGHINTYHKDQLHQLLISEVNSTTIDSLSELEQVVLCLLILGCDLGTISRYNGISKVSVRRIIANLQDLKVWDNLWLSKETSMKTSALD